MIAGRKAYRIFVCIDIALIAGILYFLYFGFYHWLTETTWSGPDDHSFIIRGDFLCMVYVAAIIPVILAVISKRFLWLIQSILIIFFCVFWKTDFLQQTLFVNQPCSTARESRMVKTFIDENESLLEDKVQALNELMKDSVGKDAGHKFIDQSAGIQYYKNAVGLGSKFYSVSAIEFYNNKVKMIRMHIRFESPVSHTSELQFYPGGFEGTVPFSQYPHPLGTNLMVVCSRKYYSYKEKWYLYFEGLCFG